LTMTVHPWASMTKLDYGNVLIITPGHALKLASA
jgi:hypothetical protein